MLLLLSHFSRVRLCATAETAAHQAPPSLGFSRQEPWSGLPFPSPGEPEFPLASPCPGIVHHLSGPNTCAHAPPPRRGTSMTLTHGKDVWEEGESEMVLFAIRRSCCALQGCASVCFSRRQPPPVCDSWMPGSQRGGAASTMPGDACTYCPLTPRGHRGNLRARQFVSREAQVLCSQSSAAPGARR